MDRLSQLKQFALEEPNDPFNHYALALEYLKSDPAEAGRLFESLVQNHPRYIPTYYPYAHWLVDQNLSEKAEQIFLLGIEVARAHHDQKALKEILSAYNDWKYEQ